MKLKNLLEKLKEFDPELEVRLAVYTKPYEIAKKKFQYPCEYVKETKEKQLLIISYNNMPI